MTALTPIAFAEAIADRRVRRALPTHLDSRQLARLTRELKRLSTFSATVTHGGFLDKLNRLVTQLVGGLRTDDTVSGAPRARANSAEVSIPMAKAQLREFLQSIGYVADGDTVGTIKDLMSDRRLSLMVETNTLDTLGAGRHEAGQNEVAMDVNPAQELVRMIPANVPRDWAARWRLAASQAGDTDALRILDETGRFVARKDSPIWPALGDPELFDDALGNPWPPFAFSSGMNVIDVPRVEAEALGLVGPDETPRPAPGEVSLTDGVQASSKRFAGAVQKALQADARLTITGGVLRLANRARRLGLLLNAGTREGAIRGWITRRGGFPAVQKLADQAVADPKFKGRASLGTASAHATRLAKAAGVDIAGAEFVLEADAVRHVLKQHGNARIEAKRGQRAITKNDFTLLPAVLHRPDRISVAGGKHAQPHLTFEKRVNGRFISVQHVRAGKNKLALRTMWRHKK